MPGPRTQAERQKRLREPNTSPAVSISLLTFISFKARETEWNLRKSAGSTLCTVQVIEFDWL